MISGFFKEYSFLSNFYQVPVYYKGITYDNAESAYQAQKCRLQKDKEKFIGVSGREAKKLGKTITVIDRWNDFKVAIMFEIVLQKFLQNPYIAEKLIETDKNMLVEENCWHDNFWGKCACGKCKDGQNILGYILMHVRYVLIMKIRDNCK